MPFLRQACVLFVAIVVGTVVVADWNGRDTHAREISVGAGGVYHKLAGKLSGVLETGIDPILIDKFAVEEHEHDAHLSIEQNIAVLKVTVIERNGYLLFSADRSLDDFRVIPLQPIEWVGWALFCKADFSAFNHNLGVSGWGVAGIGEQEFRVNHFPHISWHVENAMPCFVALRVGNPVVGSSNGNVVKMDESTFANQKGAFQGLIGSFEGAPLERGDDDQQQGKNPERLIEFSFEPSTKLHGPLFYWGGWCLIVLGVSGWGVGFCFNGRSSLAFVGWFGGLLLVCAGEHYVHNSHATDRRSENVVVHSVVVAELKFRDVKGEVLGADFVIGADDPALEDRPESLDGIGVDRADHILLVAMVHHEMRPFLRQYPVRVVVIGREKANLLGHDLLNEALQHFGTGASDHAGHDIAFALDGSNDRDFAGTGPAGSATALVRMPVLGLAANVGFIDLDDTRELVGMLDQSGTDAMAHIPSGL